MEQTVALQKQLRDEIAADIAKRTAAHQARIARLKLGRTKAIGAGAAAPVMPLAMLAHGDSWFDYPLTGNGFPFVNTDIIAQLSGMGAVTPMILNMSHHGDATTDELSLSKQQRLIEALDTDDNWIDRKPDAILFSGGGNDIVGERFCIFLDYATPGSTGLDPGRFREALGIVEASYRDLFLFRDKFAAGVPIIGHCYDFPIPNGTHPLCAGPWLQPSLQFTGWTTIAEGREIAKQALMSFKDLLVRLAKDPQNDFVFIDTQSTLADADWANELHAFPAGFQKLAERFLPVLRDKFPGRI
jgi:hypothetical protein